MGVLPRTRLLLGTSSGRAGLAGLVVLVFFATFGHMIWGTAATTIDTAAMLEGPSREHLAGTDALGRDVLARVFVATRSSLWYAVLVTAVASTLGITLGLLPSVLGRRAARALTGLINMLVAFPGLILALFVAVVIGVGATGAVLRSASPARRPSPDSHTRSPRRWPAPTTWPPPTCSVCRGSGC